MSRRNVIIGSIAVALGAFWILGKRTAPAPRFETTRIDRGRIIAKVTATGTLSALVTVQVGSQVSGRLAEVLVDYNSEVKKGQLVAVIDPQLFQAAVEQARANHLAADANLHRSKVQALDAKRQYERSKTLREKNLIAQQDLDTSQANADAAQAQVEANAAALEQARANLHQAEINLQYTKIYSPTDGTVISRSVDPGQTVAASLQAPTLFTIAQDLRKMQVHTNVAEADVGKLRAGMDTTFRVDAYPSDVFRGRISQIRNAPQTVQNVVTYDAVIDVNNDDLRLKPGMTANVTMIYAQRDDALRAPNAALRFKPPPELMRGGGQRRRTSGTGGSGEAGTGTAQAAEPPGSDHPHGRWARDGGFGPRDGGPGSGIHAASRPGEEAADRKTLWVLRDNQPRPIPIRAGITDGSFTEIAEGDIQEGDLAITDLSTDGTGGRSGAGGPPGGGGGAGGGGFRRMF